jgi:methionyl aminopeptidase
VGWRDRGVEIKTPEQIATMRQAGLVVARTLALLAERAAPGMTTGDLDAIAAETIAAAGARPSFLGYHGFPGVICTSVNEQVVHGIPGDRVLASGDVVSVDCGAIVDGWHGDAAVTLPLGAVAPEVQHLLDVTREAMWHGIAAAALGGRVTDISAAIEQHVRSQGNFGIVEEYVGHGIGSAMHQPPNVPNVGPAGHGPRLVSGLALAVEPMVTLGSPRSQVLGDDWTVVTTDGQVAAHSEHTFTVTERGAWVLTAFDGGRADLERLGVPYGGPEEDSW